MRISDLDIDTVEPNVVIVTTPSNNLSLYLEDKVKRKFHINNDSTLDVTSRRDLKVIKEVQGVFPPYSERWFVHIDLDKLFDKELVSIIKSADSVVFFCTCKKYAMFKKFKDAIKGVENVFDYYIFYLRRPDFIYLYDAFVPKDNRLETQLFNFVVKSYSGDVDAVLTLILALNKGEKFENRKAIADLCGTAGLSIDSYIFDLLKDVSTSPKGIKTVVKNRLKAGKELGESLKYTTFFNFTAKTLFGLIQIKTLMISGDVYKSLHRVPEGYDAIELSRYSRSIYKLNGVSLSRLLMLRQLLGTRPWRNEVEFTAFIYRYYNELAKLSLERLEEEV